MDAVGGLPGQAQSIASEAVLGLGKTSSDVGARHAAGDGLSQGKCTCGYLRASGSSRLPNALSEVPIHLYPISIQCHRSYIRDWFCLLVEPSALLSPLVADAWPGEHLGRSTERGGACGWDVILRDLVPLVVRPGNALTSGGGFCWDLLDSL